MEFKERRSIYLQIADALADRILAGEWGEEERIPSIREVSADLGVNPNTVMRSFNFLQEREIILNKRGIGYFVDPQGPDRIREWKKEEFISRELPMVFKTMDQLGLNPSDLETYYEKYREIKDENE